MSIRALKMKYEFYLKSMRPLWEVLFTSKGDHHSPLSNQGDPKSAPLQKIVHLLTQTYFNTILGYSPKNNIMGSDLRFLVNI